MHWGLPPAFARRARGEASRFIRNPFRSRATHLDMRGAVFRETVVPGRERSLEIVRGSGDSG
jgi:hypothetical protein